MASNQPSQFERIPTFAPIYLKSIIREYKTYSELNDEIKFYAEKHNFDFEYTKYIFVLTVLKQNEFFKLSPEIQDNFLFEATYWASLTETRRKTRPENMDSLLEEKKDPFFTKLQKETIKCLYNSLHPSNPNFDILLNRFLVLFFELSAIKRDRKSKHDL